MNPRKLESILKLSGPERYSHFVKVAADKRRVWGLFLDGWALAQSDDGTPVFPLWPEPDYAALCAQGSWAGYQAKEIDLDTLFDVLIPKLKDGKTAIGIFPKPDENGVLPSFDQVEADLRNELGRIE